MVKEPKKFCVKNWDFSVKKLEAYWITNVGEDGHPPFYFICWLRGTDTKLNRREAE